MTESTQRRRSRLLPPALLITALLGITLLGGLHPTPPAAEGATIGRMVSLGGWAVGAFRSSGGTYAYCVEPGAANPVSKQKAAVLVSSLPGYSATTTDSTGWNGQVTSGPLGGEGLRQINYVLWKYGRTTSAGRAAAVQLAVWMLRGDPGAKAWLEHHLAWAESHGGAAYVVAAEKFVSEAKIHARAAVAPKPGPLTITRKPGATSGTIRYPAGTVRLKITGGAFAGGEHLIDVNGSKPGQVKWAVTWSKKSWERERNVAFSAHWKRQVSGWPKRISLLPPTSAKQQRLGGGIGPAMSTFTGRITAEEAVARSFEPILSTRVPSRTLEAGEDRFSDRVTLRVAPGAPPWPTRLGAKGKEYAPITAYGTVYGPFEKPQEQSAEIPESAPMIGSATLEARFGPGEYPVQSGIIADEPGYYYWVWRITQDGQDPDVLSGGLLPKDYAFQDDFGQVEEGQIVPTALRWRTELVDRELDAEDPELQDRVFARAKGGIWLRDEEGERIPARLRLSVYRSDTRPQRQSGVPEHATKISETVVEVRGGATAADEVLSDTLALRPETTGWVTVQACLKSQDQAEEWRGHFAEWCDDYGMPAETARSARPAPSKPAAPAPPATPAAPAQPAPPESLALTGGSRSDGSLPSLGLGLLGAGGGALLIAGLWRRRLRRARGRRRA